MTLLGNPTARIGTRQERQPLPCSAPTEAHKGLKGLIPAGPIPASPNPNPGPRGITAITRSKGSTESRETHYGSQTLQQCHIPVPPAAPIPPRSPGPGTGRRGQGDAPLGPSRGVRGLGANRSRSYLSGLHSANINSFSGCCSGERLPGRDQDPARSLQTALPSCLHNCTRGTGVPKSIPHPIVTTVSWDAPELCQVTASHPGNPREKPRLCPTRRNDLKASAKRSGGEERPQFPAGEDAQCPPGASLLGESSLLPPLGCLPPAPDLPRSPQEHPSIPSSPIPAFNKPVTFPA